MQHYTELGHRPSRKPAHRGAHDRGVISPTLLALHVNPAIYVLVKGRAAKRKIVVMSSIEPAVP